MKVYVETQEKGKTVYPYLPILDVKIEKNGKTLGAVLEEKDKEIAELKKEINLVKQAFANIIGAIGGVRK